MNGHAAASAAPFSMMYQNVNSLNQARLRLWTQHVQRHAASCSQLFSFVESGFTAPRPGRHDWACLHHPGPAPAVAGKVAGGGISILHHTSCAVQTVLSLLIPAQPGTNHSSSSAVAVHQLQPSHCSAFLLATVYLAPACTNTPYYADKLVSAIDTAHARLPDLPLLVVGDWKSRQVRWFNLHGQLAPSAAATRLAAWIEASDLHIHNDPDLATRPAQAGPGAAGPGSVIDLVLSLPDSLVPQPLLQDPDLDLISNHQPFMIQLSLQTTLAPVRVVDASCVRRAWAQHINRAVAAAAACCRHRRTYPCPAAAKAAAADIAAAGQRVSAGPAR